MIRTFFKNRGYPLLCSSAIDIESKKDSPDHPSLLFPVPIGHHISPPIFYKSSDSIRISWSVLLINETESRFDILQDWSESSISHNSIQISNHLLRIDEEENVKSSTLLSILSQMFSKQDLMKTKVHVIQLSEDKKKFNWLPVKLLCTLDQLIKMPRLVVDEDDMIIRIWIRPPKIE